MTSLGIIVESVTINTLWHQTSEIQILEIKKPKTEQTPK